MTNSLLAVLRAGRALALVLAALYLGGCALMLPQTTELQDRWPADLPRKVELTDVPFYAQRDYECGPAALAMSLESAGAKVRLDDLVRQVYIPERKGSLQVEMLAAPRRYNMVSYQLAPRFDDVLREVAAGTPVIVLQNYGAWPIDIWHYAVVAGYDAVQGEMILRSGEMERLTMPFAVFEYLWKKSDYWAMAAVPPRRIPITAKESRYMEALVAMERVATTEAAAPGYAAAVERWPDSVMARIGLANVYHDRGKLDLAALQLRQAERLDPDSVVVLNNLAQTLSDQGHQQEALALVDRALTFESPFKAAAQETRALILKRIRR
jgi:tetratricopeptide (TPR) repeat protein